MEVVWIELEKDISMSAQTSIFNTAVLRLIHLVHMWNDAFVKRMHNVIIQKINLEENIMS